MFTAAPFEEGQRPPTRRAGRLAEYAVMVGAIAVFSATFATALGAGVQTISSVVANAL